MRKFNKKKFAVRTIEVLIVITTIILTILAINYANKIRGYKAYGGEYLIPLIGLLIVLTIDEIYKESEKKGKNQKNEKK